MFLTLSRRNLLTLLHKLFVKGSRRMLFKPSGQRIAAEDDTTHYRDREPGPVHPNTEAFISAIEPQLTGAIQYNSGETPDWAMRAAKEIAEQMKLWVTVTCRPATIQHLALLIANAAYTPHPNLKRLTIEEYRELRRHFPKLFDLP